VSDVTINGTAMHGLSATTPDDPAAEVQMQHWNASHGVTMVLAAAAMLAMFGNAGGVSFGTDGGAIVASAPVQSVQTQASGAIARSGFTTTTVGGDKVAATLNSGGLLMAVPAYLTTYAAQSVQTQASGNIARTGFTTTTVAGSVIAATHDTAGLLLAVPAYITTYAAQSVQTQPAGNIAGIGATTATTAGTEIKVTLNSAGISMGVPAYLTAAVGGAGAGTGFTTTTIAGAVVAGTLNSDGLLIAVPGYLTTYAAQTVQTQASGNIPRTGATTGATAGVDIKITHNTDGISMGVPAYLTTAQPVGAYLTTARGSTDAIGLNTAQSNVTWTANSSGLSLDARGYAGTGTSATNASITLNSNGLAINVAAPGGGAAATVSVVEIMDGARLTTALAWNNGTYSNRPIFVPFEVDNALSGCHTIRVLASRSTGTVLVATFHAGIYSRVNATSASLISSTSWNASLSTSAQYSGVRMYDITGLGALSLAPGRYLFAIKGSAAASNSLPLHLMGGDAIPALAGFVNSGTNASAATATNSHIIPMWGVYSNVSAGLPANVAASEISGGGSQNSPDIYAIIKAI
jgi:hypothetical protein